MFDKIKKTINKNKNFLIISAILWLALVIMFVAPLSCSLKEAAESGSFFEQFFLSIGEHLQHPFQALGLGFTEEYKSNFGTTFVWFSGFYLLLLIIGIVRAMPKTEYADIEHGSSDWSENGEQYRVLSRKSGIILAEENYLPLDKMGNINALIVGRIRLW